MNRLVAKLIYMGAVIYDIGKWLILGLVIIILVNTFFIGIFVVNGVSMEKTLRDKEIVLWNKNSYFSEKPERGDIVVVNYPGDPKNKKYVKRIIGLPGEKVQIYQGKVYINGKQHNESYLSFGTISEPGGTWTLKKNEYFIMGDNRPNSNDSRYFGPVERRFVLGKAISVIYPRVRLTDNI